MFIEIHILQNFAPSNLNRDDTGNPKDTDFGGVRRARISSQCIKRALRNEPIFAEKTMVESGVRTRWLAREITEKLLKTGLLESDAEKLAIAFSKELLGDMDKKEPQRSSVLAYMDDDEIQFAVDGLAKSGESAIPDLVKKLVKNMGEFTSAPDVALFGRMLARKPNTVKLDAACQVAHAISTHRVNMDMDFFTAVDDLQKVDESGSAMMGVTAFNSACFYRYARIDWNLLVSNLGGDKNLARKTVEGFLLATLKAVPTGKQNSFAAQNPPDFVLGVVRKDGESWSLANAFEKPVKPGKEGGYVAHSIMELDRYWGRLVKAYGDGDYIPSALVINDEAVLENLKSAVKNTRKEWLESLLIGLE
ncbi:MAG: type I-E CRISPR-associated protein Cas7/Cse4/CasC [Chloroflexota bacterium]